MDSVERKCAQLLEKRVRFPDFIAGGPEMVRQADRSTRCVERSSVLSNEAVIAVGVHSGGTKAHTESCRTRAGGSKQ